MNKSLHDHPASDLSTPAILSNTAPCVIPTAEPLSQNLYMLYFDDALGKYSISGYLENQLPKNIANIQLSYNGT